MHPLWSLNCILVPSIESLLSKAFWRLDPFEMFMRNPYNEVSIVCVCWQQVSVNRVCVCVCVCVCLQGSCVLTAGQCKSRVTLSVSDSGPRLECTVLCVRGRDCRCLYVEWSWISAVFYCAVWTWQCCHVMFHHVCVRQWRRRELQRFIITDWCDYCCLLSGKKISDLFQWKISFLLHRQESDAWLCLLQN